MSGSKPCTMFPLQVMCILSIIWYIIVSFKVHTNNLDYHCVHTISKSVLCAETFCKYFREFIFTVTLKWQISQSMRELVQSFFECVVPPDNMPMMQKVFPCCYVIMWNTWETQHAMPVTDIVIVHRHVHLESDISIMADDWLLALPCQDQPSY